MLRLNLDLYRKLYLIRRSEEKIRQHYMENEMVNRLETNIHITQEGEWQVK